MRHFEAENRKIQNFYQLYSLDFSEILCDLTPVSFAQNLLIGFLLKFYPQKFL